MPLTAAAAAHPLLRRERLVRALLLSAGGAATVYALYRLYRSDVLQSTARSLRRLRAALAAYADACGTGADTLRLVLADLHAFLQSDRRELPPSLRQLVRLMQSPEVADSTSATVAALWRGVSGAACLVLCVLRRLLWGSSVVVLNRRRECSHGERMQPEGCYPDHAFPECSFCACLQSAAAQQPPTAATMARTPPSTAAAAALRTRMPMRPAPTSRLWTECSRRCSASGGTAWCLWPSAWAPATWSQASVRCGTAWQRQTARRRGWARSCRARSPTSPTACWTSWRRSAASSW